MKADAAGTVVLVAGRVVAGCVVAGCVVAGCVVAGCVVAGCVVAGCVAAPARVEGPTILVVAPQVVDASPVIVDEGARAGDRWLLSEDRDDNGRREAWLIRADGRVYESIVADDRPAPSADASPIARVRGNDGSLWDPTGQTLRLAFRGDDGAAVWPAGGDDGDDGDLHCSYAPTCALRCRHVARTYEMDMLPGGVVAVMPPGEAPGRWRFEPAPVGDSACRGAFALLAAIVLALDETSHDGDSTFGAQP